MNIKLQVLSQAFLFVGGVKFTRTVDDYPCGSSQTSMHMTHRIIINLRMFLILVESAMLDYGVPY